MSVSQLYEFFSFCGHINLVDELGLQDGYNTFQINFASPKALSTATLLNDAELEGVPVAVEEVAVSGSAVELAATKGIDDDSSLPAYDESLAVPVSDHKVQLGDSSYDDISQEEKPKLAILAQLLASGYKISDDLIARAITLDKNQGISASFKSFLGSLDSKFLHTQDPDSAAGRNISKAQLLLLSLGLQVQNSTYRQKLQHYFDKAAATPYGEKVAEFYNLVLQEVADVHKEATRLAGLKTSSKTTEALEASQQ